MNFKKQPNEILSAVLNHKAIPLPKRLHLRTLSARWADIIEGGLAKETTLVIRNEKNDSPKSKADDLIIKSANFTEEFFQLLARLFPNLTQLTLSLTVPKLWSKLPALLAHFSPKLKTIKLYGHRDKNNEDESIAGALNAMFNLTSLTLNVYGFGSLTSALTPTLSRVEKFTHWDLKNHSALTSSLLSRCTHIIVNYEAFAYLWPTFRAKLANRFTHMGLLNSRDNALQAICDQGLFSRFAPHNFTQLDSNKLRELLQFNKLINLKLFTLMYSESDFLGLPPPNGPAFYSVKRLTLEIHFIGHFIDFQHFFKVLHAWFPSLKKLTLYPAYSAQCIKSDIRNIIKELPFSVELLDENVDYYSIAW